MADEQTTSEPQIPEGYVSPDELRAKYVPKVTHDAEFARFRTTALEKAKEQLLADESFVQSILDAHKDAGGKGKEKTNPDELYAKWEQERLTPVKKEAEKWRNVAKRADLVEAGRKAGVRDEYLTSVDGRPPYVEYLFADAITYDDKYGFVAVDIDGRPLPSGDTERPYMGAEAFIGSRKERKEFAHLFAPDPKAVGSSGYKGSGNGRSVAIKPRSKMSRQEKTAFISEHGLEAYEKLPMN